MAVADRSRWDSRHAVASVGEPAPPDALRGRLDLLPPGGRALDLACGRGTVAVWLAARGFDVDAVDVSPVGLAAGAELAARIGVRVGWIESDLDDGLPAGCAGPYDLLVCQRFRATERWRAGARDPRALPAITDLLAPGGLLVMTVLSEVGDAGGAYRAAAGELLATFPELEVVDHAEGDGEASLLARNPVSSSGRPPAPGSPPTPRGRS